MSLRTVLAIGSMGYDTAKSCGENSEEEATPQLSTTPSRKKTGMRFSPIVVAATVALASSAYVAPAAAAQSEPPVERNAAVEELDKNVAPPAVRIGDDLYVLSDGAYVKADRELPSHASAAAMAERENISHELAEALEKAAAKAQAEKEEKADAADNASEKKPKVAAWLVPLLVTAGLIAGLAGLFQKLYPSGRLILYYQPGKSIGL